MNAFIRTGLAGAVLAIAVSGMAAQERGTPSDSQIQTQIEHRLAEEGIRGATVAVREGMVTLGGTVANAWARDEAIEQARKVDHVEAVVNALTIARGESDEALANAVAEKVRRYVFFSVFDDVNVAVTDGVVTLTGYVTMPYKSEAMAKLASRVSGVQDVTDKLEVLPVSSFDDSIRYAIAVRIYNDLLFWNYAIQVNPPIHIIVQHGRVTLTGVVLSEVERRKAEMIARGAFGVFSVDNQLRLEKNES